MHIYSRAKSKVIHLSITKLFSKYCVIALTIVIAIALFGCSNSHKPAPVIDARGKVPLNKRVKNSITSSEYSVKKGETLYSIAWRSNTDVRRLATLNKISAPYNIYPGQKIILAKKTPQPSKNKSSSESFHNKNQKVAKKAVASTKKQAYGKNVRAQKISTKSPSKPKAASNFSQKIRTWKWPTNGKIIASFSSSQQGKKGIDIAGRRGDKIKAAADGKVVYAGDVLRGYGKLIIVKHNDDYLSAYAHNDHILVKEQQNVKAGQVIAKMGDTGSQRVMLHFEVRFRGKSVNPMKYLPKK